MTTKKQDWEAKQPHHVSITIEPPEPSVKISSVHVSPSVLEEHFKLKTEIASEEGPDVDDTDDEEEAMTAPEVEAPVFHDRFVIRTDAFDPFLVKAVDLPKILFSPHRETQSFREKSVILVALHARSEAVEQGLHKKLFVACKKSRIPFEINWLDSKGEVISSWQFENVRIQGVDFGSAAYERPEANVIAVEFVYDNLKIDGVQF